MNKILDMFLTLLFTLFPPIYARIGQYIQTQMRALLLKMSSWMVALQRLIWENGRMINDVDMEFQKGVTVLSKFYKLCVTMKQHRTYHHNNNKSNLQFQRFFILNFSFSFSFHYITSFLRSLVLVFTW